MEEITNLEWKNRRPRQWERTDEEWKEMLTEEEFKILREKETEEEHTGEYENFFAPTGYFACRACNAALFSAQAKFDSGCGWPAFERCYLGAIRTEEDFTIEGRPRLEILCQRCGGHLGHAFHQEEAHGKDERHCVNSISIRYVKASPPPGSKEGVLVPKMIVKETTEFQLSGSTVIVIGAGDCAKSYFFTDAKRLGVNIVIVDSAPAPWLEGLYDEFILVPVLADACLCDAAYDKIVELGITKLPSWGITTFWEPEVEGTALLATRFGTNFNAPEAVRIARSKLLTRQAMKNGGLKVPQFLSVTDMESLESAIQKIPFPAFLKPQEGYNSFHSFKCETPEEARYHFKSVLKSAENESLFENRMWKKEGGLQMMLESYLDGPEVVVDILLFHGNCYFSSVTINEGFGDIRPNYNTLCGPCPLLTEDQIKGLCDLAIDACACVGLTEGLLNLDLKYTSNYGPQLVEINTRMSGLWIPHAIKASLGVDLVEQCLRTAINITPNAKKQKESFKTPTYTSGSNVYGNIEISVINNLPKNDKNVCMSMATGNGRKITVNDVGGIPCAGYLVVTGKTYEDAVQNMINAKSTMLSINSTAE